MGSSVAGLLGIHCTHCNGTGKAMPPRPIENPKGEGPGNHAAENTASHQDGYNSEPGVGHGSGGGDAERSVTKYPDDKDVKSPAIKGAGGGASKRGAKDADVSVSPGKEDGGAPGPEDVWQPKSTWEHGWGSESTPDDSLSGDDGDEPDELEK